MRPPPRRTSGPSLISGLLILGVLVLVLVLPLIGGWVASTLAIHHGASKAWAVAAGLGLGLGLPLLWEVLSQPARRPGAMRPPRWFRLRTRLLLRTWAINFLFMAGALALSPREVFTALSTRGDWMLPPAGDSKVETVRRILFKAADGVEWAYVLATDNPYRDQLIAAAPSVPPVQAPLKPAPSEPKPEPAPRPDPTEEKAAPTVTPVEKQPWGESPPSEQPQAVSILFYPLPEQLHPRVASLPRSVETDLVSVAKYLVEGERDPFQRVKALHDYIADRVEYDVPAYRSKNYPSQSPEAVFQSRRAVCAGYSNLFAAMGQAVGEEIVTLAGESLNATKDNPVGSHAWNAVRIQGRWYLVDVTWDAGGVGGDVFYRQYRTKYLFMPPRLFLEKHFPDHPAWQLLDEPIDRGTALRRAGIDEESAPAARAAQAAAPKWEGIRILEPSRARAEVRGRFNVELDNPKKLRTAVFIRNLEDRSQEPCQPEYGGARHACTVLSHGLYVIEVFAGADNPSELVAQLEVQGP